MGERIELPDDVREACERTIENDEAMKPIAEGLLALDGQYIGNSGVDGGVKIGRRRLRGTEESSGSAEESENSSDGG